MLRALLLFFAAIFASPALAQTTAAPAVPVTECLLRISAAPASWIIQGYDPFGDTLPEGTFSVSFINEGSGTCTFTPVFGLAQPPFGLSEGTGRPIGYTILDLSETQDVTPRSGRSPLGVKLREIVLQPRETRSVLYKLVVDASQLQHAGTFTQDVTLEAQDRNFRSMGGSQIVLGFTVLPSARISLAGAYSVSNGQVFVDLGELRQGIAPVPLNLRVVSTGRYDISITSANSGRLMMGASGWSVPYELIIGGSSVNLNGTQTVASPSGRGFRQEALPIQFVIGDTSNRRAGTYSDVISISVTAR